MQVSKRWSVKCNEWTRRVEMVDCASSCSQATRHEGQKEVDRGLSSREGLYLSDSTIACHDALHLDVLSAGLLVASWSTIH